MAPLLLGLGLALAGGPLVVVGETVGDAVVTDQIEGADVHRIVLRLPDGRPLQVERMATRPGFTGACEHEGISLYPRWELLGEAVEVEDQPPSVRALCDRLTAGATAPELPGPAMDPPPASVSGSVLPPINEPRLLRGLLGICLALGLLVGGGALRKQGLRALAEPAAWFGLALALRALRQPLPWVGPDASFEVIGLALGDQDPHPLYRGGYAALHAAGQALFDDRLRAVWATQALLGALAVPLLWALLRRLVPENRLPARIGALALLLGPAHLALSASESQHIGLLTLLVGAGVALAGEQRGSGLLAGLLIGLAVFVRPEALPLCAALLLLLAWRGRRDWEAGLGLIFGGALLLWRIDLLPPIDPGGGPSRLGDLLTPALPYWLLRPAFSFDPSVAPRAPYFTGLHPGLTPLVLPLLAGRALRQDRRRAALILGLLLLALLPVLNKAWPLVDAWRLQLPAQTLLVVLAGLGAAGLSARRGAVALALTAALSLPGLLRWPRDWAPPVAWAWLTSADGAGRALPQGATLLVADHSTHGEKLARVLTFALPGLKTAPMGAYLDAPTPTRDLFAYIGPTCFLAELPGERTVPASNPCDRLRGQCSLVALKTLALPARGDLDLVFTQDPIEIGLYRIDGCQPAAVTPPAP